MPAVDKGVHPLRGRFAPGGDSRSVCTDRHVAHGVSGKELLNRPAYKTRGAYLAFISEESEATARE